MLSEQDLEEILKPAIEALRATARDIFALGHSAGSQAAVQTILHNATALLPVAPLLEKDERRIDYANSAAIEAVAGVTASKTDVADVAVARRAPKGLVDDVLEQVLRAKPGMTQEEVEAEVVAVDSRIATKSVYNKLRAWEKQGRRFRRQSGLWYRIADIPAPFPVVPSSPKGETEGSQSPGPFGNLQL